MKVEPSTTDHALVWGVMLVPLLCFIAVTGIASAVDAELALARILVPLFVGAYGIAVSVVSLGTGFFLYRPMFGFGQFARTTHRSEEPLWYALYVMGFLAVGVFGLVGVFVGF